MPSNTTSGDWIAVLGPGNCKELPRIVNESREKVIATIHFPNYFPDADDFEEAHANLRVMAAAPKMAAALESTLAWLCNCNTSDPATIGRQIMAALEAAGASKDDMDAATVALVRGPCSVPNMIGDSELEPTDIISK